MRRPGNSAAAVAMTLAAGRPRRGGGRRPGAGPRSAPRGQQAGRPPARPAVSGGRPAHRPVRTTPGRGARTVVRPRQVGARTGPRPAGNARRVGAAARRADAATRRTPRRTPGRRGSRPGAAAPAPPPCGTEAAPPGPSPTLEPTMARTLSASQDPGRPRSAFDTPPMLATAPATAWVTNSAQSTGSLRAARTVGSNPESWSATGRPSRAASVNVLMVSAKSASRPLIVADQQGTSVGVLLGAFRGEDTRPGRGRPASSPSRSVRGRAQPAGHLRCRPARRLCRSRRRSGRTGPLRWGR